MDDIFEALAAEVRAARRRHGKTQEQLASELDMTPESISQIERGRRKPSVETLVALSQALPLDLERVFRARKRERKVGEVRANLEAEVTQNLQDLTDRELRAMVGFCHVMLETR